MFKTFALVSALFLLKANAASAQLYDVRAGETKHDHQSRPVLKVEIDGKASEVRDYFQNWMKDNYNVKFRGGGLIQGKGTVLLARQTPASSVSNKLMDLYASFIAPSDTVTELALFGGYDDHTFFTADGTPSEYSALRGIAQNSATAARLHAYHDMVTAAEKQVKDGEKERARLEKDQRDTRNNTTANLAKIEILKTQNIQNTKQVAQDSVLLIQNSVSRERDQMLLQRRRNRLSALGAK